MGEITRIERRGSIYFKRDDTFNVCGVNGGKARAAYHIINKAINNGANEFVTAGSRQSPQCEIVSEICEHLGVKCHLFMPRGKDTSVIEHINKNKLSTIHRTKVGYNNVIIYNAKKYAEENNYYYIPFGMECEENLEITKHQVKNIPSSVKRIIIPCGSGMSMISVIKGLDYYNMHDKEVIGIIVGKDPKKAFEKFLKDTNVKYRFITSDIKYSDYVKNNKMLGIELDPIYEAKCKPYLEDGDMLWIVGKRL